MRAIAAPAVMFCLASVAAAQQLDLHPRPPDGQYRHPEDHAPRIEVRIRYVHRAHP